MSLRHPVVCMCECEGREGVHVRMSFKLIRMCVLLCVLWWCVYYCDPFSLHTRVCIVCAALR